MVQINFARKEINCKLVYYGPGLSGKTTNLEMVHERTPEVNKGELTSISTDGDRTLFFDFMPLDLGEIAGMKTKFHLYTVPGQVYYNSTRKLVLLGADGVIFVADSSRAKLDENIESLENLRENLAEMGKDLGKFPLVIQWNKRDAEDAMPVEELEEKVNRFGAPTFEGIAYKGEGVFQTLKALSAKVLESINSTQPVTPTADRAVAEDATAELQSKDTMQVDSAELVDALALESDSTTKVSESSGSMVVGDDNPPPANGGFVIERNEIGAEPSAVPDQVPASAGRPAVATNPLEEMAGTPGRAAARKQGRSPAAPVAAGWGQANRPGMEASGSGATGTVVEERPPRARPTPVEQHGSPRESYQREVRVIGGRTGGKPASRSHASVFIAVLCAAGAVAAAATAYFLFLK